MATVKWLPEALADIERLHSFLREKNPEAAQRAAKVILEGARLLKKSPHIGRPMPDDFGRRELFMAFGASAYVLRYVKEDADTIVIIRVWHGKESR